MSEKKAAAEKKHFRKNSVKGKRRGSRYPEEVKTAALADMLVCRNLSDVARRHGVPESTLRTWQRAMTESGKKDAFEAARLQALQRISVQAARSAALSVEYLEKRLEHATETERMRDEVVQERDFEKREQLQQKLCLRRAMDDGDAARLAVVLMGVLEKSREMMQTNGGEEENEDDLSVSIEVVRE